MAKAIALATWMGHRIKALRQEHGKRQEDVAAAARMFGLRWTRATVAAIETGRQGLPADQFTLLPDVLAIALERPVGIRDLVGGTTRIALTPAAVVTGNQLVRKLAGQTVLPDAPQVRHRMERLLSEYDPEAWDNVRRRYGRLWPGVEESQLLLALMDADGEPERRIARRLVAEPRIVSIAAHRVWGHSLSAERDMRLVREAPGDADARSLQALRGHITRALTEELRPLVSELKAKDRKYTERERLPSATGKGGK